VVVGGMPPGYVVRVLGPPGGSGEWSFNDRSVVLLLELSHRGGGRSRLLTTGDIERRGEAAYLANHGGRAGLLKVPHHGSETSSSETFIAAVAPEVAVISRGDVREGRYPPSAAVLDRLRRHGARIHQTAQEGAVLCEPDFERVSGGWRTVDWRRPPFIEWFLGLI